MRKVLIVLSIIVTLLLGITTVRTVAYADNSATTDATLTVKDDRPETPSGNTTPPAGDGNTHGSLPSTSGNAASGNKNDATDDGDKVYYADSLPGTNGKKYARKYDYYTHADMHELPQTGEGDARPAQLLGALMLLLTATLFGWQVGKRRRGDVELP